MTISAFERILGRRRVVAANGGGPLERVGVCGVGRTVQGVLYPRTEREVRKIVDVARARRAALYPVSTGMNWGLGAGLPVRNDQFVVDLRLMNRIRGYDPDAGTLTIEPGVTQEDAARFLAQRRAPFYLDVTGSAKTSSILGNALERGVGHYRCRASEVLSLTAILGDGRRLSTGGDTFRRAHARHSYPFGTGPDLRGLFFQSNLGIVTSVTIRLRPRRESVGVVSLAMRPRGSLAEFVDGLAALKREGVLPENVHFSNERRRLSVLTPLYAREAGIPDERAERAVRGRLSGDWAATCALEGGEKEIRFRFDWLQRRVKGLASASLLLRGQVERDRTDPWIRAVSGSFNHARGVPSDAAISSLGFEARGGVFKDPATTPYGTLFLVPILPFRGRDVARVVRLVEAQFREKGFALYATFNLVEHSNLEGVLNLLFDRRDARAVRSAHAAVRKGFGRLVAAGYPPHRMSVFQMPGARVSRPSHANAVAAIKGLFDPEGIIAPGRYS